MGKKQIFWCDACGKKVEAGDELVEFAYRYGDSKSGKAEVCTQCGDSIETGLRETIKYKNGPA